MDEKKGLYGKYTITKTETGEPIEGFAFVLKPEEDPHARWALAAYANSIRDENPRLAQDIDRELGRQASRRTLRQPGEELSPTLRKFKLVSDHIEPGFHSIIFRNEEDLIESFSDGDLLAALECMLFKGDRLSLMIELVKMSDEAQGELEPYDP